MKQKLRIRVRKYRGYKGKWRFRYHHSGEGAAKIGYYPLRDLRKMKSFDLDFADNITRKERDKILAEWADRL